MRITQIRELTVGVFKRFKDIPCLTFLYRHYRNITIYEINNNPVQKIFLLILLYLKCTRIQLIKHHIFIVYIFHLVLNYLIAIILKFCILYFFGEDNVKIVITCIQFNCLLDNNFMVKLFLRKKGPLRDSSI